MIANTLPAQIDMLLIDGDIIGCSMAYHLTKIFERCWPSQAQASDLRHTACLVGQRRATCNMTKLANALARSRIVWLQGHMAPSR